MRSAVLLVVALLAAPVLSAQHDTGLYAPSAMVADLTRFRDALRAAHPGLSDDRSRDDFDRFFTALLTETQRPRTPIEFYRLVLRLCTRVQDGHTRAFATGQLRQQTAYSRGLLPIHITVRNERIFVLRNLSDATIADGSEIVSIDGVPSNALLSTLREYVAADGASMTPRDYRLGSNYNSFYRVYPLVFGFHDNYTVVVRNLVSGELRNVILALLPPGEFQKREQARYGALLDTWSLEEELAQEPLSLHLASDSGYAVLRIRRFFKDSIDEPAETYSNLLAAAFQKVHDAGVKQLVLDLRANGGGDGANVGHLISYFVDRPFTPTRRIVFRGNDAYYARFTTDSLGLDDYFGLRREDDSYAVTRTDRIRELGVFAPATAYRYRGRVAVLIDGGTVSAAAMAAGLMRELTSAVFVGEETGGFAGMSNGIRQLSITGQHTETAINLPLAHSDFAVDRRRSLRGVTPDLAVMAGIQDMLEKRDVVLEAAFGLLREASVSPGAR
jgi:hypothetical protein